MSTAPLEKREHCSDAAGVGFDAIPKVTVYLTDVAIALVGVWRRSPSPA
jgi:hypothetical protein